MDWGKNVTRMMKFYRLTIEEIGRMTWLQYIMLITEAGDIAKEESGKSG